MSRKDSLDSYILWYGYNHTNAISNLLLYSYFCAFDVRGPFGCCVHLTRDVFFESVPFDTHSEEIRTLKCYDRVRYRYKV